MAGAVTGEGSQPDCLGSNPRSSHQLHESASAVVSSAGNEEGGGAQYKSDVRIKSVSVLFPVFPVKRVQQMLGVARQPSDNRC